MLVQVNVDKSCCEKGQMDSDDKCPIGLALSKKGFKNFVLHYNSLRSSYLPVVQIVFENGKQFIITDQAVINNLKRFEETGKLEPFSFEMVY